MIDGVPSHYNSVSEMSGKTKIKKRMVDGKEQTVVKNNGRYYVSDGNNGWQEVTKTRKGSLFGKARFASNNTQNLSDAISALNAKDNASETTTVKSQIMLPTQGYDNPKSDYHQRLLAEINNAKMQAQQSAQQEEPIEGGELPEVVVTGDASKFKEDLTYDGGELPEVVVTGDASKFKEDLTYDGGELPEVVVTGEAPKSNEDLTYDGGELPEVVVTGEAPKSNEDLTYDGGELPEVVVTGDASISKKRIDNSQQLASANNSPKTEDS